MRNAVALLALRFPRTKPGRWAISVLALMVAVYLNGLSQVYAERYVSEPFAADRVLPDVVFDNFPLIEHSLWIDWAIPISLVLVVLALRQLAGRWFNRYLRRLVLVLAAVFFLRAPALVFTTLPKPAEYCDPHELLASERSIGVDAFLVVFSAYQSCSDVFFSGHATNLHVALLGWWFYVDALSYASKRRWVWRGLLALVTAGTSVTYVYIVMMHFHYTIDVIFAVLVTSFVFFVFHALWPLVRVSDESPEPPADEFFGTVNDFVPVVVIPWSPERPAKRPFGATRTV